MNMNCPNGAFRLRPDLYRLRLASPPLFFTLQVYTPEQRERISTWAARAESGAAMKHFWSPSDAAFLSRYTSAVTSEVGRRRVARHSKKQCHEGSTHTAVI